MQGEQGERESKWRSWVRLSPEFSYAFTNLFHCKFVTFPTRFLVILHFKFVTLFPPAQVDNRFVKVLTVNIYRTLPECFATMDYLSTVNPKHQTRNPKPQTLNPELQSRETLNPKPRTSIPRTACPRSNPQTSPPCFCTAKVSHSAHPQ